MAKPKEGSEGKDDQDVSNNDAKPEDQEDSLAIKAVSVKMPAFIFKAPDLWFLQAEAQFGLAHVINDKTKYFHIVSALPQNILMECRDVIPLTYSDGAFEKLKTALIKRYCQSTEQRIKDVLDNIQYNPPELPSAFFRRLWSSADGVLPYDVVLQRFRDRLPSNVSNAIAPMTNKLHNSFKSTGNRPADEEITMLEVADAIQPQSSVSAVSNNSSTSSSTFQRGGRPDRRSRSASRGRSRSPSARRYRENGSWCRNHFTYREQARKCSRPGNCAFRPRDQPKNE